MSLDPLPGRLPEIEEVLGRALTFVLTEKLGGIELYIPQKLDEFHFIAEAIGLENARKLSEAFVDQRIYIPNCKPYLRKIRMTDIKRLSEEGLTGAQLAVKYGLTERQIRNILSGEPSKGGAFEQQSLFEEKIGFGETLHGEKKSRKSNS